MTNQVDGALITINQAAIELNVHPNTIRNAIASGKLNAQRYGARIIRLQKQEVLSLLTPYQGGEFGVWSKI